MNHDDLSNGAPDAPTQAERTEDMLSMSMFSTRADYDAAARAQAEQLHDWPQQTGINSPFNACMYRDDCRSEHAQRVTLQHHAADQAQRIADLEVKCVTLKRLHDAAADERDELRARLAEIEAQEPVAWSYGDWFWSELGSIPAPIAGSESPLYARPVPAQAVPESVDGLVSVFCYDEVLTFTFCDEAAADRFAGRFDPSVDSAEAPEHKA